MRHDLLVIGSGPAGVSAALQGAKLGLDVALVERAFMLGGACVHQGTIPSKTLRETILRIMAMRRAGKMGIHSTYLRELSMADLLASKDAVIQAQVDTLQSFLERNQIHVLPGSGSFVSPNEVRVATSHGERIVAAEHVILATGSRPRRPDNVPFDDNLVMDSDSILSMNRIPRSLAILGAGVIGCEYACMMAALGVKVSLIDRRDRVLRFLDDDVLDGLHFRMRRMGVRMLLSEAMDSVRVEGSGETARAVVRLKSGRVVKAHRLLMAAGRESNTASLNLGAVGIETDETGLVKVDEDYRTTTPNISAVGDVIGFPALAGTGMHQGRVAVLSMAGKPAPAAENLPTAIYTIPEISMVGLTEQEARDKGLPYEVGVARYSEVARGQILGDDEGLLKLVFRRDDRKLLGVHLLGQNSAELVHMGMAVLHAGGTIDALADSVFNHPTLSEAYRVAALDGLNRL